MVAAGNLKIIGMVRTLLERELVHENFLKTT